MDALTDLALMFKKNENPKLFSMTTGIVLAPLPDIQIKVTDVIILDKSKLIVLEHIYAHYQYVGPTWLKEGDEVVLMPTTDEQLYYLLDVARRLT